MHMSRLAASQVAAMHLLQRHMRNMCECCTLQLQFQLHFAIAAWPEVCASLSRFNRFQMPFPDSAYCRLLKQM